MPSHLIPFWFHFESWPIGEEVSTIPISWACLKRKLQRSGKNLADVQRKEMNRMVAVQSLNFRLRRSTHTSRTRSWWLQGHRRGSRIVVQKRPGDRGRSWGRGTEDEREEALRGFERPPGAKLKIASSLGFTQSEWVQNFWIKSVCSLCGFTQHSRRRKFSTEPSLGSVWTGTSIERSFSSGLSSDFTVSFFEEFSEHFRHTRKKRETMEAMQ